VAAETPAAAETATAPSGVGPLEGSYKVTLGEGDVKRSLQASWTIRFLRDGGVNDGPTMVIQDDSDSVAYSAALPSVEGDTLTLANQECEVAGAGGDVTVAAVYTFELSDDTLRLKTKPGSPTCKDGSVESILTSKPLERGE
jgi:hypothetical protein